MLVGLVLRTLRAKATQHKHAAIYAFVCIALFTVAYKLLDVGQNFDVPDYLKGRENSWMTCFYTSVLAQSNAMPDTVPQTTKARLLFMLQVCLGWWWFLLFA